MCKDKEIQEMKSRFQSEYPYLKPAEINRIYRYALGIYLTSSFPYQKNITELPDDCVRDLWWIERCMEDLLQRNGCSSAVAYSENGLSIRFDNSMVSKDLMKMLVPKVGVPK